MRCNMAKREGEGGISRASAKVLSRDEYRVTVGRRMRSEREQAGWRMSQLELVTGVSARMLSDMERGLQNYPVALQRRITAAMEGKSMTKELGGLGYKNRAVTANLREGQDIVYTVRQGGRRKAGKGKILALGVEYVKVQAGPESTRLVHLRDIMAVQPELPGT